MCKFWYKFDKEERAPTHTHIYIFVCIFDMILFVGVMPVRTSNSEQAWSSSFAAFQIFPILSASNNNNRNN